MSLRVTRRDFLNDAGMAGAASALRLDPLALKGLVRGSIPKRSEYGTCGGRAAKPDRRAGG